MIPAYNEEKRIAPVIRNFLSFFRSKKMDFEIIVACNNCSDATPQIMRGLAEKNRELACLNFPFYTGKGGAVFRGFRAAKKSIVGFADADDSTSPEQFYKIYEGVSGGFDASIGSRVISGSLVKKKQPLLRLFAARCYRFIVELLFGMGIPDTQCGAKVFRKKALNSVLPLLNSTGWEFDVELLWRLKQKGFSIRQVPIAWKDAHDSRLGFSAIPKMFFGLFKTRFGL